MIEVVNAFGKLPYGFKKALYNFLNNVCTMENCSKRITIILVDGIYIRKLNREFLGRDYETDVLSFDMGGYAEVYVNCDYARNLGDFSYYTAFYSLHGLLHVIGYDHKDESKSKRMESVQKDYMKLWKF